MLLVEHYVASSPVHGLGVFTKHFVPKGTRVWMAHPAIDTTIPESDLASLPTHVIELVKTHSEYLAEQGLFRLSADGAFYMNHSDQPNLVDKGDEMFASCDINQGEELFCDYRITKVMAFDPSIFELKSGGAL